MRLWHKDLIAVLPKQQLLGQWRECCAIARNIEKKRTPNHLLVNKILDYPNEHFHFYTRLVYVEMRKRGYKCDWNRFTDHFYLGDDFAPLPFIPVEQLFPDWHNDRYLKQCYYNLQEKFDCGGITEAEWKAINDVVNENYFRKVDEKWKKKEKHM